MLLVDRGEKISPPFFINVSSSTEVGCRKRGKDCPATLFCGRVVGEGAIMLISFFPHPQTFHVL
jgi:hypothetical protein